MLNKRPAWAKDVIVCAGFTLLNLVLLLAGMISVFGCGWRGAGVVWLWVFAFPLVSANALHFGEPVIWTLFFLNPFIYGLVWWFMWKMFRLMRAKPPEGDSPPLHNE